LDAVVDQHGECVWHRHATLGYALDEGNGSASVGVQDRDWGGVVRAVTEQRRDEHRYLQSSISELREALWACVETVHNAVKIDHTTDSSTDNELDRAKHALKRLPTGSIKQEVLGAVLAIEGALQTRREQQQEHYVSLATALRLLNRPVRRAEPDWGGAAGLRAGLVALAAHPVDGGGGVDCDDVRCARLRDRGLRCPAR
jgi:hypothetical protein